MHNSNKLTALLPMKRHSERVPNKNLELFNGKPLCHSIMNQLILAKRITKIIVNTDSNNIKENIIFNFKDIKPINHNPGELKRTQDLEPYYEENSNFYIFSRSSFKNSNNKRIGVKPNFYEMNKVEAIDIDDESDFVIAETLKEKM